MPTPLTDADKVLRNDTGKAIVEKLDDIANAISSGAPDNLSDLGDVNISSPTSNQALVYNPTTHKWENGEVSTVGSIDDLDDVDTTGKAEGDSLRYNGAEWVAQPTTVKLTLAEYNALTEKAPNTRYIITDAPALEYTAEDLSYDGGTTTVKEKIDEKADKATTLSGYGITDAYTKTEINNTLANYLTNAIYKSTAWGSFAGLVTNNSTWLFVAQRLSTNNTYVCVLNRYNNNYSIKDIVKDSSMSIVTNDQGTVTFNYGGSPTGVHVMALKIAQS